jgi:hypothetical protein
MFFISTTITIYIINVFQQKYLSYDNNRQYLSILLLTNDTNVCKVQVIQKSSKIFFFEFFIWFDRARRALQKCIY